MTKTEFLQFMDKVRMYDLTQPLSIHTPPWPSYMPLGIQYFKRIAGAHMGQGANGQIITTSNHVGTHMDGEIHFHPAAAPSARCRSRNGSAPAWWPTFRRRWATTISTRPR